MSGIFDRFSHAAERFQDRIALQIRREEGLRSVAYGDIRKKAVAVGSYLSAIGVGKSDRVAIFAENSPEWCIAYLGIAASGAVAVPLDAQYTVEEVRNLLRDSDSKAIFTSDILFPAVKGVVQELGIDIIRLNESIPISYSLDFPSVEEADPASLLYTSGTTGTPKGVLLTHGNLISNAEAVIRTGIVTDKDHILGILPLHHTYPFMVCFLAPVLAGGKVTFLNSLKGPEIVKSIKEDGITILIGVPQLYSLMRKGILDRILALPALRRRLAIRLLALCGLMRRHTGLNLGKAAFRKIHENFGSGFRFFASGGAKLDIAVANDLEALGFTVLEGYGLTETSPLVALNLPERKRTGSVGRAIEQVEVKIDRPDSSGVGEIVVKGPNVMKGYYKRDDLTAEVIKDGYFHSGDLGYIDPDGYLFITGRSKEVIVLSSGKNIYPEDIENHYLQSRFIKEICVTGVPDPSHPGICTATRAIVVPDLEKMHEEGIVHAREQIRWEIERYSASLTPYKRVGGFEIRKEPLPRTHLGKIRRFMITGEESGSEPKPATPVSTADRLLQEGEAGKGVIEAIAAFTSNEITPDSNLELDLGIDSLSRVELTVSLEKCTGGSLPQDFLQDAVTVREVIAKVAEATGVKYAQKGGKQVSWGRLLRKEPPEEMIKKIRVRRGAWNRGTLALAANVGYVAARVLFRFEVKGMENLPREGAFIVAPNHVSYLDGFLMGIAMRKRLDKTFFVAIRGFFKTRLASSSAGWAHIITIDANSRIYESLQASAYVIREGDAVCVFPEGGRSVDGRILPFKKGVGILAKELSVPLVPTYIKGALDVLPRGTWLPKPGRITISFGKPMSSIDIKGLDYQEIADKLRERVIELSGN